MRKSKPEVRQRPGPKPKIRYCCVPCGSQLGAREVRTHRRSCPCRTMFCTHLLRPNRPGPKPKIHYLCMVCLVGLSESGVRTHHQDCPGKANPISTRSMATGTKAESLAQLYAREADNRHFKELLKELERRRAARR